ncbi:hypothetical protein BDR07DRAFT_1608966 [Suillus spraguei]|nr:hypothetical protein BDR07DRAFT_1608966 [Suillus spraguei]
MKLTLVFSTLASIVALATAYPTQGTTAKRSYVEKRDELDTNLFDYPEYEEVQKRDELDTNLFDYPEYEEVQKRDELDTNLISYHNYEEVLRRSGITLNSQYVRISWFPYLISTRCMSMLHSPSLVLYYKPIVLAVAKLSSGGNVSVQGISNLVLVDRQISTGVQLTDTNG